MTGYEVDLHGPGNNVMKCSTHLTHPKIGPISDADVLLVDAGAAMRRMKDIKYADVVSDAVLRYRVMCDKAIQSSAGDVIEFQDCCFCASGDGALDDVGGHVPQSGFTCVLCLMDWRVACHEIMQRDKPANRRVELPGWPFKVIFGAPTLKARRLSFPF